MSSGQDHNNYAKATGTPSAWRGYLPAIASFMLLIGGIAIDQLAPQFWQQLWWRLAWYLAAYLPVGLPVLIKAIKAIAKGDVFSEFFLMSLATIGAFFIQEYPEGVAVMLFYAVGELFQDAAVDRAKRNIQALLDVRPDTANVMRDGVPVETPAAEVKVGDIIRIRVGDRVPLDGKLLSDQASFDTAALTGESVPRTIVKEAPVLAGMIATDKVVDMEVTKPFGESSLARILDLVQNAAKSKSPTELFIRKLCADLHAHRGGLGRWHRAGADAHRGAVRLQHLALPRAHLPGDLLPVCAGHQHSAGLLRRHRRGKSQGHIAEGRQLPRCAHQGEHHRDGQDRHAHRRRVRRAGSEARCGHHRGPFARRGESDGDAQHAPHRAGGAETSAGRCRGRSDERGRDQRARHARYGG